MDASPERGAGPRRAPLAARWSLQRTAPDQPPAAADWLAIPGPSTVAAALQAIGQWSLDDAPRDFDLDDWWFRAEFDAPPAVPAGHHRSLAFEGLAGRADVWLNGRPLLASTNMFLQHRCADPALQPGANELRLRFASLATWLAARRPRPRWRTPMVTRQQLRFARVGLLGRTPGWSPPAAAVGPWRPIEWIESRVCAVSNLRIASRVESGLGELEVAIDLTPLLPGAAIDRVRLQAVRGDRVVECEMPRVDAATAGFAATLRLPEVALWWPHTHGEPALYDAVLQVHLRGAPAPVVLPLRKVGFRSLAVDTTGGDFALSVNGVPVFARGACWTPLDPVGLQNDPAACDAALRQVRDAGMNMLRVAGSTVYEDDRFHAACDALGLLVWQDFMFANMDYPADDPAFAASVRAEALQQLQRWQASPSLAVLCGNSEVSQQAAMWGAPRETWSPPLFERDLAELARAHCPGVPWVPSSAHGGGFPHQPNVGTTSYYGVGAYLRPLDDARRSGLRFATECLALANVPCDATLARLRGGAAVRVHQAAWKERSPRDLSAGWDFDDVRDHYLQQLYRVDPVQLRATDHARYLALGRAVSAEVLGAVFAEWRRPASTCRGALVWFLRDLWAGAGWGLLDDRGLPKAAFHGLRRACAPRAVFLSDEGTNGLELAVLNEPDRPLAAHLVVARYRDDGLLLQQVERRHTVAPRGTQVSALGDWFDGFVDLTGAYRFGPVDHEVLVASLHDGDAGGALLGQAFHFPAGLQAGAEADIGLTARAERRGDGGIDLHLQARRLARSIDVDWPGYVADDAFFHLAPGSERRLRLQPHAGAGAAAGAGHVQALNLRLPLRVVLP